MTATHTRWRSVARLVPLLLVLAACFVLAAPAAAAPSEPTLNLEELQAKLDVGPLAGYMKTTMSGYTATTIPVEVSSLVDYSDGTLIFFKADDSSITDIGGIADGMSGSPIYVNDGGTDKLIGAVSYGDIFTLGGLGLATPIEYMSAIEDDYQVSAAHTVAPGTYQLDTPRRIDGKTVKSVVVARSADAAQDVEATTTESVMHPLGLIEIGGLPSGSKAFKKLAAKLEAKTGLTVRAATGSGSYAGPPAPDLQAGSPCAMLFSDGAVWYGAAGTVTYVHDGTAVAFGHPAWWVGATDAEFTAAYVQGVWASSYEPYLLMTPRDTKGTVTQDRDWGIAADLTATPDMFPVSVTATFTDGDRTVTSDSNVAQWFVSSAYYSDSPIYVVEDALYNATDAESSPGTVQTRTQIQVSDATGSYTVDQTNLYASRYDVLWDATDDLYEDMWSLTDDPDGVLSPRIDSITVDAAFTSTVRSLRVAGLSVPGGFKTGDNTVTLKYYKYGSADLQSMDTTLTLPKGMSTNGRLRLWPARYGSDYYDYYYDDESTSAVPQTLKDIVDELNARANNSDLELTFTPFDRKPDGSTFEPVSTIVATDSMVRGSLTRATARVMLRSVKPVAYGGTALVRGYVWGIGSDPMKVDIYKRGAGKTTDTFVKSVTVHPRGGYALLRTKVPGLTRTSVLTVKTTETDKVLVGTARVKARVKAAVRLSATGAGGKVALTVHVKPADADGTVRYERLKDGKWVKLGVGVVKDGAGKATFRLASGSYKLRAVFLGAPSCLANASPPVAVTVQ